MGANKGGLGAVLGGAAGFMVGGPAGAAIGAGIGGSVGGGMAAQDAAEDAARAQQQGAALAIAEQQAARQQIAQQLSPYMQAGNVARGQLLNLMGLRDPEQQIRYEQARTFTPQFSEKERNMIIQAGPSQRGRGAVPPGGKQPAEAAPTMLVGGRPVRMSTTQAAQQAAQQAQQSQQAANLQRYQQALAERNQIAQNQQFMRDYEAAGQSPEFGLLSRDVTQGLPQAQLAQLGALPELMRSSTANLPALQTQFQGLPGVAMSTQTGLPSVAMSTQAGLPGVQPGDIGQDTLFQSLKREAISGIESSAAARGKLFSGTTPQAIAERVQNIALERAGEVQRQNLMARQQLMGERGQLFGESIGARQQLMGERGQLFGESFGMRQQTAAEQQQEFQRAALAREMLMAEQGRMFAESAAARGQMIGERGQLFAQDLAARQALLGERVGEQERRFQQVFSLTGLGQASAAQQAANLQGAAANIGNLYTQQANAAAAGMVGAANAQNQMLQGLLGAGTTLGAASLMGGGGLIGGFGGAQPAGPRYISPQQQLGMYYMG